MSYGARSGLRVDSESDVNLIEFYNMMGTVYSLNTPVCSENGDGNSKRCAVKSGHLVNTSKSCLRSEV